MTQVEFAPVQEQYSAGLNQLNIRGYQRIQTLSAAYKKSWIFRNHSFSDSNSLFFWILSQNVMG